MPSKVHWSEAVHVVTHAHLYRKSYVTLCYKFLSQHKEIDNE